MTLDTLSWIGIAFNAAAAILVAHGTRQRLGYALFLISDFGLIPILVAHGIWSQVWMLVGYGLLNVYAIWRRRASSSQPGRDDSSAPTAHA